nr:MAG TPA: hypothetical protein [Caudoviricetes sp.]
MRKTHAFSGRSGIAPDAVNNYLRVFCICLIIRLGLPMLTPTH